MKILIYSAKPFEIPLLKKANKGNHQLHFTSDRLTSDTSHQAINFDAISIFSADDASTIILEKLHDFGVRHIALRSAGYDNINVTLSRKLGFKVANAPDYSPSAIAEHAIALFLGYNRKIIKAQKQIHQNNFLLDDLIGFDLYSKTVGVMGTGKIGKALIRILSGFGCRILANDINEDMNLKAHYGVNFSSKESIAKEADVIFLCLPLNTETHHLFDKDFLGKIKNKPILVNVSRGAIVQTEAILDALDNNVLSGYATDVYEKEYGIFFYNHSEAELKDTLLNRLIAHPKVLLTPHQAFATEEALTNIAEATLKSMDAWEKGKESPTALI